MCVTSVNLKYKGENIVMSTLKNVLNCRANKMSSKDKNTKCLLMHRMMATALRNWSMQKLPRLYEQKKGSTCINLLREAKGC